MKVKDLIKTLQNVDGEMLVFCTSDTGDYKFGMVDVAQVKSLILDSGEEIDFDSDYEDIETDCFVISEC